MYQTKSISFEHQPRILIASMRNFRSEAFRSAEYEFEDAIYDFDFADMLAPSFNFSFTKKIKKKISNRLANYLEISDLLDPGCYPSTVDKEYDLFIFVCQYFWDLTSLNSIHGWREKCHKAVLWIDEIWIKELENKKTKNCLKLLKNFDYIFTTQSATAKVMEHVVERPCLSLPYGIDAIKSCPDSEKNVRNIDVYSIGRRSPITHQSLLELAENSNLLYIHDTLKGLQMINYKEHRQLYRNLIKRSRYFIANKAKFDTPNQTGGQEELGSRFFEGAAGGSVMIGIRPECEAFTANFDWNDAVIDIPYDAKNISEIITELDSQPQRLERIRKDNITNSLLRHDWVYRWECILTTVELRTTPAMENRKALLKQMATSVNCLNLRNVD
jgi:Glycosyl transferases group 1